TRGLRRNRGGGARPRVRGDGVHRAAGVCDRSPRPRLRGNLDRAEGQRPRAHQRAGHWTHTRYASVRAAASQARHRKHVDDGTGSHRVLVERTVTAGSDARVLVIGGGVIGLSTAFVLVSRSPRLSVTVLERSAAGEGASRYAGAMDIPYFRNDFQR